ncbi:MAG: hypothetical protein R2827_02085 [Bdellovibrionales bacterium]
MKTLAIFVSLIFMLFLTSPRQPPKSPYTVKNEDVGEIKVSAKDKSSAFRKQEMSALTVGLHFMNNTADPYQKRECWISQIAARI